MTYEILSTEVSKRSIGTLTLKVEFDEPGTYFQVYVGVLIVYMETGFPDMIDIVVLHGKSELYKAPHKVYSLEAKAAREIWKLCDEEGMLYVKNPQE
jgi:hypothetical protein